MEYFKREAMEDEYPFRRLSLQEYPGRSYYLQPANTSPVTRSPVLPGSPVLPMRRRTVSQQVPRNVQYEYVQTSPNDDMLRKYSLEEYRVLEPQDPYLQNQPYYQMLEVQPATVSQAYRPVQQVQPYYSVAPPATVVQTCMPSLHGLPSVQKVQSQPGQLHLQQGVQQPIQQIQLVHPIQQMQPNMEYVEIQSSRSAPRHSYMPFTKQTAISSDYYHDLADIREDKTPEPDKPKHVTFEKPLVRIVGPGVDDRDGIEAKASAISAEAESMYEPYVGLKKAPAAVRRKNISERRERLREENGEKFQVQKEVEKDKEKVGRFSIEKVDVLKKDTENFQEKKVDQQKSKEENDASSGILKKVQPKTRRHTVHTTEFTEDKGKARRNAMCPLTAYTTR